MNNQFFRFTSPSRRRNVGFPMVQADIPIAKKRENVKIELQALHFLNKKAIRTRGSRIDFFEQPKNDLQKIINKKEHDSIEEPESRPEKKLDLEGLRKHFEKMFYYKENISALLKEYLENNLYLI